MAVSVAAVAFSFEVEVVYVVDLADVLLLCPLGLDLDMLYAAGSLHVWVPSSYLAAGLQLAASWNPQ